MTQKFGDGRTEQKLEIVEEYSSLFIEILGAQNWVTTHYIDAFAGEGYIEINNGTNSVLEGSVTRIMRIQFDRFHFIENDSQKCGQLRHVVNGQGIEERAGIYEEDANIALPRIVGQFSRSDRSLIFIDPFGMQLNWQTLSSLAAVPWCDIVYLFPCHGVLRGAPNRSGGLLHPDMKDLMCSCLGMTEQKIVEEFYAKDPQGHFFPELQAQGGMVRMADYAVVENLVLRRLRSLFTYVYDPPYRFTAPGRAPIFSMYLMTSNPSIPAINAIRR